MADLFPGLNYDGRRGKYYDNNPSKIWWTQEWAGIKCNGSRINAIQSGMMGYCEKIYLVKFGKQA